MRNPKLLSLFPFIALALISCGGSSEPPVSSSKSEPQPSQTTASSISSSAEVTSEPIVSSSEETISSEKEISSIEPVVTSIDNDPRPQEFRDGGALYEEEMEPLGDFTPTRFQKESLKLDGSDQLSEGVRSLHYSFKLNNGNKVEAEVIEIDPDVATIRSNYNISHENVYTSLTKYQNKHDDVKILAGINADFFGSDCVNAYVQEGAIIKAAHNDNGIYDYTVPAADIPASKPMLFGIGGSHVRIAPIVEDQSIETTIKSSFRTKLKYAHADKVVHEITNSFSMKVKTGTNTLESDYTLIENTVPGGVVTGEGDTIYYLQKFQDSGLVKSYRVDDSYDAGASRWDTTDMGEDVYLFVKAGTEEVLQIGDTLSYCIGNDDGKWDNYQTIIGGRQSLVENGAIAPTVTLENSNGAQNTGIPRSCVGITPDHKVLVTGIEGLRYGKKSTSSDDPYGVSLPELAEFERAIGCYDCMNFDGGGSTQLFVRGEEEENFRMLVRSSDYGTTNLNDGRRVYNTLLVGSYSGKN